VLYLLLIIFALAGGVIAVLAFENFSALSLEVHLVFFGRHAPALPLGVLLLLAFVLGALLLYAVSLLTAMRERRELRRLRNQVAELEVLQQALQPDAMPHQSTAPLYVPMPGTQSLSQAHGPQYLFPPPGYWRNRNQGR
jgi:uncharacterized integral membrane protein